MSDELYPEEQVTLDRLGRAQNRAWDLYDLVKAALANPTSWVEWQREAIAVVDYVERGK